MSEWTASKAPTGYISVLRKGNTEIYRQSLDCLHDLELVADAHNSDISDATKPLVDAVTKARKELGCVSIDAISRDIDAALANVKDGK